jgi:hypothetical protein
MGWALHTVGSTSCNATRKCVLHADMAMPRHTTTLAKVNFFFFFFCIAPNQRDLEVDRQISRGASHFSG